MSGLHYWSNLKNCQCLWKKKRHVWTCPMSVSMSVNFQKSGLLTFPTKHLCVLDQYLYGALDVSGRGQIISFFKTHRGFSCHCGEKVVSSIRFKNANVRNTYLQYHTYGSTTQKHQQQWGHPILKALVLWVLPFSVSPTEVMSSVPSILTIEKQSGVLGFSLSRMEQKIFASRSNGVILHCYWHLSNPPYIFPLL